MRENPLREEKGMRRIGFFVLLVAVIAALSVIYAYLYSFPYVFMGVVDGLNVCSLALMALLISLMYNVNADRNNILLLGIAYILGVFFSYFLIGLGFLVFSLSLPPHFFTKISVPIMISIGILNVMNYFHPGLAPSIPTKILSERAVKRMRVLTFPSVLAAGMLVGLHNLPCACTGGVYMTFISLIANAPFKMAYLILYDFLFVSPLIGILYTCSSKSLTLRLRRQYAENAGRIKLALGTIMILLSLIILLIPE